ncbi:membrane dipeptidase [Algoriphagus alkaliphilus]|uniref:Membrane dipeptidase n=1 Tax=Algoriphagus alkaliphilus TaxID=279824 RepID=A0A1G5ZA98_9BACT|nr:membrane dipeptidase [Algoriphagus alkaliphilus]MBA4302066.1 peptidase M19 [Cyclobacterium sp.]SDA91761.1 membrane dipeptidase [Algoriphagus alkaliphilus]
MFTIDAHLDLSMNALEWNRDLTRPVSEINAREKGMTDKPDRGNATVSLPELRKGNIGLVVATQIARFVAPDNSLPGWHSPEQAWAQTQGQLAWYQAMVEKGEMNQIRNITELEAHLANWNQGDDKNQKPVGFILSLEGADSIVNLNYLEKAYESGLRALGPAHYGPGRYAFGTDSSAPLSNQGKDLVKKMDELGIILDATHLCDLAFWDALEIYQGPVWASHNNCRALVDHNRQFSDEMIKALIDRGAVIGAAFDAWMLSPGWVRGKSTPKERNVTLPTVLDHLDHICQIAGNANHIGIGSDLDGAFGTEQCPSDLETIADLKKIPELLQRRGYNASDIEKVMHGNWLNFLKKAWS